MSDWDTVRELGLHLPDVEEGTSYGTPALKVAGRMFVRLRPEADEQALVLRIEPQEREFLLQADPERFFVTPHYDGYPAILARLSLFEPAELADLLTESWLFTAPKRLAAAYERSESGP